MNLNQFDYVLPETLIAQYPLKNRTSSRLLSVPRLPKKIYELSFQEIDRLIFPGDLIVVNDTRVVPARLHALKPGGGKIEIMLEKITGEKDAIVLLRSNKPVKEGQVILIKDCKATVMKRHGVFFEIQFSSKAASIFKQYGEIPLPPYIKRNVEDQDEKCYQTVYAKNLGATAAPTAGLHFDNELINRLIKEGVQWASITLHVGAGTFQPVRVKTIKNHTMHEEYMQVRDVVCRKIKETKEAGNRVIAIGTTVVRALESIALDGFNSNISHTNLFIYPGFKFCVVDSIVTNFHLPKSTLLMMVSAFSGYARVMQAYQYAVREQFRFFSYGDAMYLEKSE